MNKSQIKILKDILIEIGKFSFTGLTIGYFISPKPMSISVPIVGGLFSFLCFMGAIILSKEG